MSHGSAPVLLLHRGSLGNEEREGKAAPHLMKEALGGSVAPKEEGTCPQEQPCKQRLREGGENGINGTIEHVTPCDTSPGSTTAVGDTQTSTGAGLGIRKIPSGMEQSCGLGRVQTWPSLTTTPQDKSFIATG